MIELGFIIASSPESDRLGTSSVDATYENRLLPLAPLQRSLQQALLCPLGDLGVVAADLLAHTEEAECGQWPCTPRSLDGLC